MACSSLKKNTEITPPDEKFIGVVVVSYCSGDYLLDCLETLLASTCKNLKVVVCDNASPDETVDMLREWAQGKNAKDTIKSGPLDCQVTAPKPVDLAEFPAADGPALAFHDFSTVTLLRLEKNIGFAGAVNAGISALRTHAQIDMFWILNPDCQVHPDAAAAYRECAQAADRFGLMGSRLIYMESPYSIQSDGGAVNEWTGLCRNLNQGGHPDAVHLPDASARDFVSGSNVIASREFIETVGLMNEDYFIYYEEVDWAARRGDLPILWCEKALVYHHGGTIIGTGSVDRAPTAFANYFNFRNRIWFMKKFHRSRLLTAFGYSVLKIFQLLLRREWKSANGAARGLFGLPPSKDVANRISKDAAEFAFVRKSLLR